MLTRAIDTHANALKDLKNKLKHFSPNKSLKYFLLCAEDDISQFWLLHKAEKELLKVHIGEKKKEKKHTHKQQQQTSTLEKKNTELLQETKL